MLKRLFIENLAIIDHSEIEFEKGLNVLTGETGAGKSIIIGAINLILGERASSDDVRTGARQARVEALFDLTDAPRARAALDERGLLGEDPDVLIIRREIQAAGKSRHFINGSNVQLTELRQITGSLVDLHGQHQHQALLNVETHRETLDACGDYQDLLAQFTEQYKNFTSLKSRLRALEADDRQVEREKDMIRFQIDEIESVDPHPGEDEALALERSRLSNAETLMALAQAALDILYEGEQTEASAILLISQGMNELEALSRIDPSLTRLAESLAAARVAVEDVAFELRSYSDDIEANPARLQEVDDRLDLIKKLRRKYGATVEDILAEGERLRARLEGLVNREADLTETAARLKKSRIELGALAARLSEKRKDQGERWARAMEKSLAQMAMPNARFAVALNRAPAADGVAVGHETVVVGPHGVDEIEFLISPNPSEDLRPLRKVASGGELSRVMLALKSQIAAKDQPPTLIFDEIDAGISGATAERVGRQIEDLARSHQILCITHLPQIAARGTTHFSVEKAQQGKRNISRVRRLTEEERLDAIASLFSGDQATPESRNHARFLIEGR